MAKRSTTTTSSTDHHWYFNDLLPEHLLALIAKRLDLADLIRFGCVCSSWKSISPPVNHGKKHITWLLNPVADIQNPKRINRKSLGFFFFNNSNNSSGSSSDLMNGDDHQDGNKNQFYVLERQEMSERTIIGSSCQGGWLVTVHDKNGEIQLFHPFSRALINLPPFPPSLEVLGTHNNKLVMSTSSGTHHNKVVMSYSSNNNSSVMILMAIHCNGQKLAFCRVNRKDADDKWTSIKDDNLNLFNPANRYHDVTYYKGQFYVLHSFGEVLVVKNLNDHRLDTDPLPYATKVISKPEYEDFRPSTILRFFYLVECSGELLLVIKWALTHEMNISPTGEEESRLSNWRIVFKVFKLDFGSSSSTKWMEVKSLGDHSIFLSCYRSFSVSADHYPCCQKNCIYFSDQYTFFCNFVNHQSFSAGHDIGIFHMEDGKLERCYPSGSTVMVPHPMWYTTYI